jgi:hypothetical protein
VPSEGCSVEEQSIVYCGWAHPQYASLRFKAETFAPEVSITVSALVLSLHLAFTLLRN